MEQARSRSPAAGRASTTTARPGRHPATAGSPSARAAHALVSDLLQPRPWIYYGDLAASALVAWGALAACLGVTSRPARLVLFAVAVAALYRAAAFIHELTHLRPGAVPGLDHAWNAVVGVPLLMPSLLYAGGVHSVHHAKPHYGTRRDPEYLPLARWPRWRRLAWVLHAALLPVALVARFLVLAPASLLHPRLRAWVWSRASSLSINPEFVRQPPPRELRRRFLLQEAACAAWATALAALVATGVVPLRPVLVIAAAAAAVGVLNQLRTLIAHRFAAGGGDAPLAFEEQFLDSVNVPGHPLLTALWAPVGLRYHGLHHLLPGIPYHALGAAHRRLAAALPRDAAYHRATEPSLLAALRALDGASRRPLEGGRQNPS